MYAFPGAIDGSFPSAGVVRDASGDLYGTTSGGAMDSGTVYQVTSTGVTKVLHTFSGGNDGAGPFGIARDNSGNLYGATSSGGANNRGVVYKLTPSGVETVLYSFGLPPDGSGPSSGVTLDAAGNIYGTTMYGGTHGEGTVGGTVYKVSPAGVETILYNFTGGADGGNPKSGPLTVSRNGSVYGTTSSGGLPGCGRTGNGVVYKVDPTGVETVLYAFSGGADGAIPQGALVFDAAGNIYGTTALGGLGNGVVYRLDTSGNETVLYGFTGSLDGDGPYGLVRDGAGNLYGVAQGGGSEGDGVVFEVTSGGAETVLYNFQPEDGYLNGNLIRSVEGSFYGTTVNGGAHDAGEVFRIKP